MMRRRHGGEQAGGGGAHDRREDRRADGRTGLGCPHATRLTTAPRDGYVLFAVLIVVVVLSLVAYRFTESMTAEYRAAVRTGDDAQARLAAVSGVHYAAAMLADPNTFYSDLGGNPFDNAGAFFERVESPPRHGTTTRRKPHVSTSRRGRARPTPAGTSSGSGRDRRGRQAEHQHA